MSCRLSKSIFSGSVSVALILSSVAQADFFFSHEQQKNPEPVPWFTGPLLAPSGHVIPKGNVNIEPYIFYTANTGVYSSNWKPHSITNLYSASLQVPIQIGIAKSVDCQFAPEMVWNRRRNENFVDIGDLPVAFDFQLLLDSVDSWNPAAKLSIRANVPLGKYKHLHASKLGTDAVGSGSWLPGVTLALSKLYHFGKGIHFLGTRLAFAYTVGTVAYVKGLNSYGGGEGTRGKAYPGNTFIVDGAIEFNLTQRWVFAMDTVYSHTNKTRFSGKTLYPIRTPSAEQFSLAPAIEYNWNENIGVIGGVWFTIAGRNAARFTSGVFAVNIYI